MYKELINKISNDDCLVINENFLKLNKNIVNEKLKFWKKNTRIKFNDEGRCEINIVKDSFAKFLQEEIENDMRRTNDFVPKYLEQAILHFTENTNDFIITLMIDDEILSFVNIYMFYKNMKYIILDNPIINITYEVKVKENKYFSLRKMKTKIVKKEIKLSKILEKMNSLMLENEEKYNSLMNEKKGRIRDKIKIENELKTYKDANPYWVQQKYLPYKNKNLIFSINPLDIFTCSGLETSYENNFNLTKFKTCYSTSFYFDNNNDLVISEIGEYSNPSYLYKLSCMLTKGIIFIPNGNELNFKDFKFMGMAARSHLYLQSKKHIYCEISYPEDNISFSEVLNSIFRSINFFDQRDLDYNNEYSNNDYYIVSEFEEDILSFIKNKDIYLDNIGLFLNKKRYCIFTCEGSKFNHSNGPITKCANCGSEIYLPFRENYQKLDEHDLDHLYCDNCKDECTCDYCGDFDENIDWIDDKQVCSMCKDKLYIECDSCGEYNLKEKSKQIDDKTFICEHCQ